MMHKTYVNVIFTAILFNYVNALDVVSGKSGEEQVKEALERAQKESEEAARKDKQESPSSLEQLELKHYLKDKQNPGANHDIFSSNLASVLGRKVEVLRKYHENRVANSNNNQNNVEVVNNADMKEKSDSLMERESDRKMVEMARKLNNLVQKFQRKIGRLSEGNRPSSYLNQHPKLASFLPLHSKRPVPPQRYAEFMSHLKEQSFMPQKYAEESADVKSIRATPKKPSKESPIDLLALRKALGLLHKGGGKGGDAHSNEVVGSKTSYKEDTKLEDRLAMEAEEEKKFSNSDNYEYGMSNTKSSAAQATFSPKEQASKEMQSYNDLISSESNRELSQIQDEITKATQSSLGQVTVVGQKEHVSAENPESPLGGIGSLEGIGSFGQESGGLMGGGFGNAGGFMKGAIDASSLGPVGNSESFPGSAAANEALESALQASANADMNGESMPSLSSPEAQSPPGGESANQEPQEMGTAPIEIGGNGQEQQADINSLSGGSNPFAARQIGIKDDVDKRSRISAKSHINGISNLLNNSTRCARCGRWRSRNYTKTIAIKYDVAKRSNRTAKSPINRNSNLVINSTRCAHCGRRRSRNYRSQSNPMETSNNQMSTNNFMQESGASLQTNFKKSQIPGGDSQGDVRKCRVKKIR